jgi:DNA-binding protein HU-beta
MNKAEMIDQIARSADITKAAALKIVNTLDASIKTHIDAGGRVILRGVGTFQRGEAVQREGRNPQTGQPLTYTAYRRRTGTPLFSESKLLKEITATAALDESTVHRAVDAFKGVVKSTLKKGGVAILFGFGTFYSGQRSARSGRNPQTGATIRIPAARVPKFRASKARNQGGKFSPSKALKDALN